VLKVAWIVAPDGTILPKNEAGLFPVLREFGPQSAPRPIFLVDCSIFDNNQRLLILLLSKIPRRGREVVAARYVKFSRGQ
jgi:hypothetical protein